MIHTRSPAKYYVNKRICSDHSYGKYFVHSVQYCWIIQSSLLCPVKYSHSANRVFVWKKGHTPTSLWVWLVKVEDDLERCQFHIAILEVGNHIIIHVVLGLVLWVKTDIYPDPWRLQIDSVDRPSDRSFSFLWSELYVSTSNRKQGNSSDFLACWRCMVSRIQSIFI